MFKNKFTYSFLIIITTTTILLFSYIEELNSNTICNAESTINNDLKYENTKLKYKIEELEGSIDMLKDALNELGATTPDDAINIWSKGIQTRNGYLQYSVLCDDMKLNFIEDLSKSKRLSSWVTGYSSPWVSSYNVVNLEKINSSKYKATINFNWDTSIGHYESTEVTVTTTKIDNKWCISDILWDDIMKELIF